MTIESATILFTDVVGSTELSQGLSPDAAEEVRRGHFSILRQAIAEAGGTEVKNLGDGLMVVFTSASAALGCGVAMQQGVERDNRNREHSVGLRVGLSGGEVTREDDDYFGDPVVEAARLCAACESGQVLATDIVRGMAGRRNLHECHSLGERTLKGLTEPVETVEVVWEPLGGAETSTSIPLPSRLAVRPAVGVVGRETEMQTLTDAAKRVAAGEGREVLLVSGEAGLGKTTLVAEAARAVFDSGACVLFGHCEEDLATPYQLFAEALRHYVTHAPEDQLRAHVEEHGSELSRLVPALASRIPDLPPSKATDSDTERFLLFAAAVGLLASVSANQPVVLVLDDLQWADKGSLLLLRHLAASDVAMRLLVVGTYRDSELSNAHSLVETLATLRRLDGVSRIDLVGLDDTGVIALMEAAVGHRLDDDAVGLAHAIYRETDGNPFFVSEVLRNLTETGAIRQNAEGRWVAEGSLDAMALPDSVREVIGARVLRLGKDAGRVLSVASVIGRDFDLDLLARATTITEDDLLDILDTAAAVSLVRELADTPGHYNFTHALIQHTLYEDLGPTRRARAHRRVAEALESLCGDRPGARVGELARHWTSASQPIDLAKAMGYSKQAGDAALGALAPADALRYYAQALDLYPEATDPDPVLGIDLAIGLGTAQRQIGDPAFRDTLLGAARRAADLGDSERLVAAALANNRGQSSVLGVIDTDRVEILEIALARLPDDHTDRAGVLATLCSELAFGSPIERRQALADQALAIARASGDDATLLHVLNLVLLPLYVPKLLDQLRARCDEAMVFAERVGDPAQLFFAANWAWLVAELGGDIAEMDRYHEICETVAEQLDQPLMHWYSRRLDVARALIAGDVVLAERLATECHQIGLDGGQPDADFFFGAHLLVVNLQRGAMASLIPIIEQMATDAPDIAQGVWDSILALAYVEDGRLDEARQLLARYASDGFDLPLDTVWLVALANFASVATECGAAEFAEALDDHLAPLADRFVTTGATVPLGHVSHFLGGLATVLGRYDEADAFFSQSAAFNERIGATFFAAQTDLLWGRMLAKRDAPGDAKHARDLLLKAQHSAAANGYGYVERRVAEALRLLDA